MSTIADNIAQVAERIRNACQAVQRDPHSVQLLAVSKTKPAAALREAHAAGLRDFGENYPVSYTHLTLPTTPYV